MNTKLNLKDLVNNPENVNVVRALFKAEAYSQTITEIVETKQREILNRYKWQVCNDFNGIIEKTTILDPKQAYKLSDTDFDTYIKELDDFYYSDECPIKPKKQGNCPALEAQTFLRDVKIKIADYFKPFFGYGYDEISRSLDTHKTYFDLMMSLFAHKIKP